MKTFKTTLVVLIAALLPLALFSAPTSAALKIPDQTPSATLNLWDSSNATVLPMPATLAKGQKHKLQANFDNGARTITLYGSTTGGGWSKITAKTSKTNGNAYFDHTVAFNGQRLFAEDPSGKETNVVPPAEDPEPTPTPTEPIPTEEPGEPGTGTLTASSDGKTWTAKFTPAAQGQTATLKMLKIYTEETNEVNEKDKWIDVATGTQDASGTVKFSVSKIYRVEHEYQAVSGASESSKVKFKIPATTPKNTGLSAVYFNTNEGAAVDSRDKYREGEFSMTASSAAGCDALNSGMEGFKNLKVSTMKGRGNYSWSFKRKSYTLKLGKKANLCGMGENSKWALVSNDYDKSFLRNPLAQYIASNLDGMDWAPQSKPVDFYMNGKYMGLYMLVERISIGENSVNIDELKAGANKSFTCNGVEYKKGNGNLIEPGQRDNPTHPNNVEPCVSGGYLMEWDFRKGADYNAQVGNGHWVGIKDPENDLNREGQQTDAGISVQQKAYIKGYLNDVDDVLRSSKISDGGDNTWKQYIDVDSAVDYYIAMEFMKPIDGNMWASVYMYKPRGGKLHFGPIWDFDLSSGSANRAGNAISPTGWYLRNNQKISAQQPESTTNKPDTWFNRLNKNPDFRAAVKARWKVVEPKIHISNWIEPQRDLIAKAAAESFKSSPSSYSYRISTVQTIKGSWTKDVDNLKSWANKRESWLTSNF